jgi:threonine-phosphate decarboxylase
LEAAQGFTLANADSLCTVIDDTMDLVCLCNPNNPTGSLIEREMILEILEHCKACGTRVLLDECFNDFIEEPQRYTLKSDLKAYPNLFLLKAFTKRYSMAGIRLGYGMCWDEELLERMRSCVQPWNLSIPAQEAGIAALQEEAYVEQARELVAAERRWMKEALKKLGFTVYDSRANYIFFRGPKHLVEHCLKQQILIRDCSNYEGLESGYYRVAVKLHEENLRLLEALRITGT